MENANNKNICRSTESTPAVPGDQSSSAWPCQAFPPEIIANCLADLKRQIALRQAMP